MGLVLKRGSAMPILGSVPAASRLCGNNRNVPPDPDTATELQAQSLKSILPPLLLLQACKPLAGWQRLLQQCL
ncbi:S-adenosylmethionine:tRNA ribosyltransferase-isomerase, partial [Dissostichus eleginoides]